MKVLWLCNIMLPALARELGVPASNKEGWLTGIYDRICRENRKEFELAVCFPVSGSLGCGSRRVGDTVFYGFQEDMNHPEREDEALEGRLGAIIDDFRPDLVHCFGTEYPHTLAMERAFAHPERTLLGIQGLCHLCAPVYMAKLPERVRRRVTFRDWLRRDSLAKQQEKFRLRGEREREALKLAGYITGRTGFDREGGLAVNPKADYFPMNETLRSCFYEGRWSREKARPHSIFVSQGDYPLKGFHFLLQAMPLILEKYPDAQVAAAGADLTKTDSWKDRLKLSSYGKYLLELIRENRLEGHVAMLGRLDAEQMKQQYLRCQAYVCPSVLENSPNSLGEAMLLGVPCAASRAGGIPDMLQDGKEGRLFTPGQPAELAEAVCLLWERERETEALCGAAALRARKTHDPDINYARLLQIYREIV